MNKYLVGGAVRDQLLGLPVSEKDWVVVGSTPAELLALGFKQVGKDFPVFLHPKTGEEYALARTERKTASGHHGFDCFFSPDVSLEDDLLRRDLTINAMAMDDKGNVVDPYQGAQDIKNKTLRHVSDAFKEDPLRVLRVARFASKLKDFGVSHETLEMMKGMIGELSTLPVERVWKELSRALEMDEPWRFFEVLKDCDVFYHFFPQGLTFDESFQKACDQFKDATSRLIYLYSNQPIKLLKTQFSQVCHAKHITTQVILARSWVDFLRSPESKKPSEQWRQLKHSDAIRRPERLLDVLKVVCYICECDFETWVHKIEVARTHFAKDLIKEGYQGAMLGKAIDQKAIEALNKIN